MASSVFRLDRFPSLPTPLPRVPGPKLTPFTSDAQVHIEFVEFLGRENDVDSLVWKVKINGAGHFALKVFYFRRWEFLRDNQAANLTSPLAHPQLYVDYFDPFNCECRAYDRLKDAKREDLAVKAHGYLLITPQQEADLERRVTGNPDPVPDANVGQLTGHNFWNRYEQHRGLPVRAIVRELVSNNYPTSAQAGCMWPDLQDLHSLGILVGDTHGGNYLGGKLVDFSRSLTMYHPGLHYIFERTLRELMLNELQHLLDHYYFLTNLSSDDKIAVPQDLEAFCSGDLDRYQNLPITYDWLQWEEDPAAAVAYVEQALFKEEAQ
ncbi:kinetochore Sim4 complex subunit FTA2-domain-containing protein [Corynascus novoguineensis]|uniref:Kinetochore Sim4 complex subunit FTA2-domain-containing protein n=1 Tax=Corynascus novoguineensis TaxID=1126955 RepID=A0AAN7CKI0_9PEZI|nr:kinetochore Sim4 complex subunit FTA2-domain-containing protein [Corynascus novoguineensis]